MKKIRIPSFFILLFCMLTHTAFTITPYRTNIINKNIHTLQVYPVSNRHTNPIIELNGKDTIEINFDVLHKEAGWYAYSIVHCNADWTPSDVASHEYIEGFRNLYIDDFANSLNTTKSYTNYHLFIPNEDVRIKTSGNYAVLVFNENDPSDIIFTACFSVVETKIEIDAEVKEPLDTKQSDTHQEINFIIRHPNYEIEYPKQDIKAFVYQNQRWDNAAKSSDPSNIDSSRIAYQHDPNLVFNAGNEYRQMIFFNNKDKGTRVSNIQFKLPFYYITLMTDHLRKNRPYIYDRDMNGRYIIRNNQVEDPDTEADYNYVDFTLQTDSIEGGSLYLNGALSTNSFNEQNKMNYNSEKLCYEKRVLLKQGIYNYQYLFVPDNKTAGETKTIEGNFYNTENEYLIMIYHRSDTMQYDKLIGIKKVFPDKTKIRL